MRKNLAGLKKFDLRVIVRSRRLPLVWTRPFREVTHHPFSEVVAEVKLLSAEEGVMPGQACEFHETGGSRVLGSGWTWREN